MFLICDSYHKFPSFLTQQFTSQNKYFWIILKANNKLLVPKNRYKLIYKFINTILNIKLAKSTFTRLILLLLLNFLLEKEKYLILTQIRRDLQLS